MERSHKKMHFDLFRMLAMAVEAMDGEGNVFKAEIPLFLAPFIIPDI